MQEAEAVDGWQGRRRCRNIDTGPVLCHKGVTEMMSGGSWDHVSMTTEYSSHWSHILFFRWNRKMELFESREATHPFSNLAPGAALLNLGNWLFCHHGYESRCLLFVESIRLLMQRGYFVQVLKDKSSWERDYEEVFTPPV